MKYIRFKHRGFFIFEETQTHSEVARIIGDEVESAGFVHCVDWVDDGKPCTSGRSESLNIGPMDSDERRIRARLSR